MGGQLLIRNADDRTPPPLEGLEAGDGEWRLSLEPHRDLLVDLTGIEPDGDLALGDLETIRARLEGYVEREKQASSGGAERTTESEPSEDRSPGGPLRRLLALLAALVPGVGTARARETTDRETDERRTYSLERVRHLARVFRAAADDRRREIVAANAASTAGAAAD